MTAFDEGRRIERQGLAMVAPLLRSWGTLINNMDASPEKQKRDGDFLIINNGRRIKVEFKTEVANKHNKLFFETWSNMKKGVGNPGWVYTCEADGLLYLFQESKELYVIPSWEACRVWFLENILAYKERRQAKYKQKNVTLGRPVPIKHLLDLGLAEDWSAKLCR